MLSKGYLQSVERSLAAAHEKYGDEFLRRWRLIAAMPADSLSMRKAVRAVFAADDPGEAMMKLGDTLLARLS
jgi:hypothetical protein